MEKQTLAQQKKYIDRIRPEAKAALAKHPDNIQMMYTTASCQMCHAHLTIRQLNRVIIEGVPPLCLKDYKLIKHQMADVSNLFGQLSLF